MPGWGPVTQGESGARVFRSADGSRYRKVVGPTGAVDLAHERDRVSWAHDHGLPAPAVLDWGATDDGGAYLVTSAIEGIPADQLTEPVLRAAWPSVVAAVRVLHEIPVGDCPFERGLDTMLARARGVVASGSLNRDFLRDDDRGIPVAVLLARVECEADERRREEAIDPVMCHGDLCLPNILVDSERFTGFIDLGRLGVADRHADLALLLANTADTFPGFSADAATQLAARYPVPIDDARLQFYLALDPLTWG
ncbi:APH(3'') family aminoglycoside O-phosphotransferase [Mycolicibacterium sp. XJ870]